MKHAKLQTKLFLAYLFLACIVVFSFAAFFYIFVSRQLTESQLQAMSTLNSSFQNQVDASIQNLDTVSVNINYSNMSKNVLDQSFNLNISDDMLSQMADLFISLSGTELKADQVNLFDFSGNVLQAGLTTMVKDSSSMTEEQEEFLKKARELEGTKVISHPYKTNIYSKSTGYEQWYISLYRSFNNQYRRSVGVIETVKQCKTIFKSVISYEKKNKNAAARIYIYDKDGYLIYPYEPSEEDTTLAEAYYEDAKEYTDGSTFSKSIGTYTYYAAKASSSYSGYTYLTLQPQSVVLAPIYNLLRILFVVVGIFLAVSAVISYRLARSVVKPVKHLKHVIQRIELDTLGQENTSGYPVSVNELEELYQAFQNMSDKLQFSMKQLIEVQKQELKSRTLALQSQINPHFYYNSLSSIIVLAENGDTDTVCSMCRNLSKIMRYITDSSSSIVTLQQEIDYVQKYLFCMKVRYQSSLNYTIQIDECLLNEKIPKLIIQPIVENAVKYGSNCLPPWNITIKGYVTENGWMIDVIDSGNGFSEEAINKITQNIHNASSNPGMPDLKIHGLGMLNVYLRWKLFCKDDLVFKYGNTEEGHGIVSIGRYKKERTDHL